MLWRPAEVPADLLIAVSERGAASAGHPSPTAYLARSLAEALGHPELPIVRATQVHGNHAVAVDVAPLQGDVRDVGEADILMTRRPGIGLVVQTADCLPILLAGGDAVAAVHAGWRGLALDAAGTAVRSLTEVGIPARAIRVWIGPSIGPCCYEVGTEVASRFPEHVASRAQKGSLRLDLRTVARGQLEAAGIPAENISFHPDCTHCAGKRYASFRRDGSAAGRMIALIARLG